MLRAVYYAAQIATDPRKRTKDAMRNMMGLLPRFTLFIGILLIILQATGILDGGHKPSKGVCYEDGNSAVTPITLDCVAFQNALELNNDVLLAKYVVYICTGVLGIYASQAQDAGPIVCFTGGLLAFSAAVLSFASMGLWSKCESKADTFFAQIDETNPISTYWWVYLIDVAVGSAAFAYCVIWYYWHDVVGLGHEAQTSLSTNVYTEMPGR